MGLSVADTGECFIARLAWLDASRSSPGFEFGKGGDLGLGIRQEAFVRPVMTIRILDAAECDLAEGRDFYEKQQAGLGAYFLDTLFSDIDSLQL